MKHARPGGGVAQCNKVLLFRGSYLFVTKGVNGAQPTCKEVLAFPLGGTHGESQVLAAAGHGATQPQDKAGSHTFPGYFHCLNECFPVDFYGVKMDKIHT